MSLRALVVTLCGIQAVCVFNVSHCPSCDGETPRALEKAKMDPPRCAASGKKPNNPEHALKFCHVFPDKSCCIPAQDAEIEEHYFTLLDAGDICAKESSMARNALKMIFCAACSPKQPDYIDQTDGSFKICSTLAKKVDPTEFDSCGMVQVAERGNLCAGDDVIVPGETWPTEEAAEDVEEAGCCDKKDADGCPVPSGEDPSYGAPAHSAFSCQGYWKFINDATGAYPPFLDGGVTSYIQIVECEESAGETCNEKCFTGGASSAVTHAAILAVSLLAVLSTVWA